MPISIIAGNWKMNTTLKEARALVSEMKAPLEAITGVRKVVCPPFISIAHIHELLEGSDIAVGAQNMYHVDKGAYTGEISPSMLRDLCEFVILGHSERRQYFGETYTFINQKVQAAMDSGLKPILCVGEELTERDEGKAEEVVERQLTYGLADIAAPDNLVIAYEPIWAIGTGRAANADQAQEMMECIRRVLTSLYGSGPAAEVPLLYGGSVSPENVSEYIQQKDVNGALVGGASLKASSFVEIVEKTASCKSE